MKRKVTDGEKKTFAKHISYKDLVSKVNKEFLKLDNKKKTSIKTSKRSQQTSQGRR